MTTTETEIVVAVVIVWLLIFIAATLHDILKVLREIAKTSEVHLTETQFDNHQKHRR